LPTLFVLQGPDKGRGFQTSDGAAVIGRVSDHIPLTDTSASRRHAEIRPENGSWVLADLQSSNGTFLNGQRVFRPMALQHGDQIRIGATVLVFGGREHVESFTGPRMIQDEVDLDITASGEDSSILTTVNASGENVIVHATGPADAATWNVVYRIAEVVGTADSPESVLERVSDIVFDHIAVDCLVVLTCVAGSEDLVPQVVRIRRQLLKGRPRIVTSKTIIHHVLRHGEGVLCANAQADSRFSPESNQDSIHLLGLRSILCVPILSRDQVHGILYLDCVMSRHTYTEEQLRSLVAVGRLAGMAMENQRFLDSRMRTARLAAAGETVAYLSHHIRNILQGLQGGAEVVELGFKRGNLETASSGWTLVRRNLDRIYQLAMNMLTFSKERDPCIKPAPLNEIIDDVLALSRTRAEEKGVSLRIELGELPDVPMDAEGIHQMAHNIVLNAVEAAPRDGGIVSVRTFHDAGAGRIVLSIADNGPGIPESERERIFTVFHSSKGQGGTGLGLAAAKKIVDELRGEIRIESAVGHGTTFHILLWTGDRHSADQDRTRGIE